MTDEFKPGFWSDLTGASPRWGRTLIYAAVIGRLGFLPIVLLVAVLWGEGGFDGFSGQLQGGDDLVLEALIALVVAPLLEQMLVLLGIVVAHWAMRLPPWPSAGLVAVLLSALHGLTPGSAMVFPLFLLLAVIQINWMRRGSMLGGFVLGTAIHGLVNAVAVMAVWIFGP
jgi:hypothetical protein